MSHAALMWTDAVGYLASLFVFTTFCMRTMIALRIAAIGSNICFIVFGLAAHVYPVLVLHIVLLPLNAIRTVEMLRLTKRMEGAAKGLSLDPLKPFMKTERYLTGQILFEKGSPADRMFLIVKGELLVEEVKVVLKSGELIGEIGLFSSNQIRMSTVHCLSDVELLSIAKQHMAEICFQNPQVSFYFLTLIADRLLADMSMLRDEKAALPK